MEDNKKYRVVIDGMQVFIVNTMNEALSYKSKYRATGSMVGIYEIK